MLLLRRRESASDHWSGHWCFPGGRRQAEDADLLDTALRELVEECGLALPRTALEKELPIGKAGSPERHVLVAPFVLRVERPLDVAPAVAEMAEARWLSLEEFRAPSRHAVRSVPGQPPGRLFPAFDLPPTPLWGFTYRLLAEWAGVPVEDERT